MVINGINGQQLDKMRLISLCEANNIGKLVVGMQMQQFQKLQMILDACANITVQKKDYESKNKSAVFDPRVKTHFRTLTAQPKHAAAI